MNRCYKKDCTENSPYGFRLAGKFTKLTKGKRGYLWACEAHRKEARARKEKAET